MTARRYFSPCVRLESGRGFDLFRPCCAGCSTVINGATKRALSHAPVISSAYLRGARLGLFSDSLEAENG